MSMCKAGGYSDSSDEDGEEEDGDGGGDADPYPNSNPNPNPNPDPHPDPNPEFPAKARLVRAATAVLRTPEPFDKARLSAAIHEGWTADRLHDAPEELRDACERLGGDALCAAPDAPARPVAPETDAAAMRDKVRKIRQGNRKGLLHSVAHAESYAIDLMWDLIARFGRDADPELPLSFYDDFAEAAAEEARHFLAWCDRLDAIGAPYGSMATHDGLWESASRTAGDLAARLSVVHCVHEARGLDTYGSSRAKLERCGDVESIAVLERNVAEEVHHVRKGVKWLKFLAEAGGEDAGELFRRALNEVRRERSSLCSP